MSREGKSHNGKFTRREALALLAGSSAAILLPGAARAASDAAQRVMMSSRELLPSVAGTSALATPQAAAGAPPKHAPVLVGGKRVKTVDVHAHVVLPEVTAFLKGTPLERANAGNVGEAFYTSTPLTAGGERLQTMDKSGIDVQALSVNVFWYGADRDLAERLIAFQNQKLLETINAAPAGRFVAYSTVALQFPDLAARQLEDGMKMGLKGASIGGSVQGEELSLPKYDVFWAKAEALQAPIFVHPQDAAAATGITKRAKGNGVLNNVIGNPLETTIFLSHMIFDGVLERFPRLQLCAAHGGGYLPSYADRMDHGCLVFPDLCKGSTLTKKPTEYLRQVYVDSLVFTPEALRHLVAEMGPTHVMLGTDYPYPWTEAGAGTLGPVDHVFATPGLSNADKAAILGATACAWLGIPA